jgi:hypothetical protein
MWTRYALIFTAVLGAVAGALVGGVVGSALAAHRPEDDLALLVLWATVPIGSGVGALIGVITVRRYLQD